MSDSNLPIQAAGVLITYYISQIISESYQEYQRIGTTERWIRLLFQKAVGGMGVNNDTCS
jgi:hypothetical protein